MLCLMWEYLQQSQNACSVSSALHQLTGTLLIRKRTEGIRVGGKVEEEEGVEGGRGEEEEVEKLSVLVSILRHLSTLI